MWSILIISSLYLVAPISAQLQNNNGPSNCVLNEKRPNPLNAHTFYYCRADGPTLMMCPEGLIFDSSAMDCIRQSQLGQAINNISLAKIPSGGNPPPPPPPGGWSAAPPPPPPSGGWSPPPPPPPPSGGWSPPPASGGWSPPPTPPVTCPATDPAPPGTAVYLPNKNDCTQFYECSNGTPYLFDCPDNKLIWDITLNVCNFPALPPNPRNSDPDCPNPDGTRLTKTEESRSNEIA